MTLRNDSPFPLVCRVPGGYGTRIYLSDRPREPPRFVTGDGARNVRSESEPGRFFVIEPGEKSSHAVEVPWFPPADLSHRFPTQSPFLLGTSSIGIGTKEIYVTAEYRSSDAGYVLADGNRVSFEEYFGARPFTGKVISNTIRIANRSE